MRARFFSICMALLDGSVDMAKAMVLPSTSFALKPTMLMLAPFIQTSWKLNMDCALFSGWIKHDLGLSF